MYKPLTTFHNHLHNHTAIFQLTRWVELLFESQLQQAQRIFSAFQSVRTPLRTIDHPFDKFSSHEGNVTLLKKNLICHSYLFLLTYYDFRFC